MPHRRQGHTYANPDSEQATRATREEAVAAQLALSAAVREAEARAAAAKRDSEEFN